MTRIISFLISLIFCGAIAFAGEIAPFSKDTWKEIRIRYKGKPVAVHFWGLTCAPCRAEMPEWGRFRASHPNAEIVLIHAERPPPAAAPIEEFLRNAGLESASSFAFADTFQQPLRYAVDPSWRGELPMTLLIAGDGSIETITGSADLARVAEWFETQARGPQSR